jgi:alpha-glucosidase
MTIGEENLVRIPNFQERYAHESIMVHEFAHNIDFAMSRISRAFRDSLRSAFQQAKEEGLWADTYSMSNTAEYFAEGAQAWFNTCRMHVPAKNGKGRFTLRTREQLRDYDPRLYTFLASLFPEQHLQGYHFDTTPAPVHE